MINFFAGSFLIWLPKIAYFVFPVLGAAFYIWRNSLKIDLKKWILFLSSGFILYRVLEAALKTGLQRYLWSLDSFTKIWTETGYWLDYSYRRFWLNLLVSLFIAFIFFLILKFLRKYKDRFFEDGEVELGFFTALLLGWPKFLFFAPMVFFSVVVISLARQIIYKKIYTTLGYPFLLATLITLIFGDEVLALFNLGVFKI